MMIHGHLMSIEKQDSVLLNMSLLLRSKQNIRLKIYPPYCQFDILIDEKMCQSDFTNSICHLYGKSPRPLR